MALEDKKFRRRDQAKSVILSWFSKPSTGKTELNDDFNIAEPQVEANLEIPLRHQSRMYTPYHNDTNPNNSLSNNNNSNNNIVKRQSYNGSSNKSFYSQLNRSASWQPQQQKEKSTLHDPNTNNHNILKDIPDRRTSRNYVNDPEAQAKLESLLNSERLFHIPRSKLG